MAWARVSLWARTAKYAWRDKNAYIMINSLAKSNPMGQFPAVQLAELFLWLSILGVYVYV